MDGELPLLAFLLIGFKYIRRFAYWSVSQLRLMRLPSGWPKRPSRLESYFTQGGGGRELVAQEGGMKVQEWRGFFFLNIICYYWRGQIVWYSRLVRCTVTSDVTACLIFRLQAVWKDKTLSIRQRVVGRLKNLKYHFFFLKEKPSPFNSVVCCCFCCCCAS